MQYPEGFLETAGLFLFAECFLTIPLGIFLGKISRVLVENAGITWQEIKNMLLNDYGEDFMMKVSKKKIYKIIKQKRKTLFMVKTISLIFIIIKGLLAVILTPEHYSQFSAYEIVLGLNSLATFMYFVYWVRMIIYDRKINGDSISIRKSIKKNLFEPYVENNIIDIQGEARK